MIGAFIVIALAVVDFALPELKFSEHSRHFGLLSQIQMISDGNFGDSGGLHILPIYSIHPPNQLELKSSIKSNVKRLNLR